MNIFTLGGGSTIDGICLETSRKWNWTLSWGAIGVWRLIPGIAVMLPNSWLNWWHFEFSWLCVTFTIEKRYKKRPVPPPTLDEIIRNDLRRAHESMDQRILKELDRVIKNDLNCNSPGE